MRRKACWSTQLLCCCFIVTGCSGSSPLANRVEEISVEADGPLQPAPLVSLTSDDWPWWRGPNRNGLAAESQSVPATWSEDNNVLWKSEIPGRGHSSPTVVGERILFATADEAQEVQSVLCYDRRSGVRLWKTDIHTGGLPGRRGMHPESSHASCTVACDGERLFVAFLNNDSIWATALDVDGDQVWQRKLGPFVSRFGYGASPTIHGPLVVFAADHIGGGFIAAVHRVTGKIVWRKPRQALASYSSAIAARVAGRDQLLICGTNRVAAYNPETGEELWACRGTAEGTCGTMVFDGDVAFASGGHPQSDTLCVKADGSAEVLWRNNRKAYVPSLLVVDGYLYGVNGNSGIGYCWEADTGQEIWRARFQPKIRASPVYANGRVYLANTRGVVYVLKAGVKTYELLSENQLGDEIYSTPTICGGRIYLRVAEGSGGKRQEYMYCIGTR